MGTPGRKRKRPYTDQELSHGLQRLTGLVKEFASCAERGEKPSLNSSGFAPLAAAVAAYLETYSPRKASAHYIVPTACELAIGRDVAQELPLLEQLLESRVGKVRFNKRRVLDAIRAGAKSTRELLAYNIARVLAVGIDCDPAIPPPGEEGNSAIRNKHLRILIAERFSVLDAADD